MADLHKFQDDVKSEEGRTKAVVARHLDENFTTVRIHLSKSVASFLYIKEQYPKPDELDFVLEPSDEECVPLFSGGVFSRWVRVRSCDDDEE